MKRLPPKKKPSPREQMAAAMVHSVLTSEQVAARWRLQAERIIQRRSDSSKGKH